MSAGADGRSFEATPARKARALREGNIARSSEAGGITAFACSTMVAVSVLPFVGNAWTSALQQVARRPVAAAPASSLACIAALALAPAAAAALGSACVQLAQAGGLRVRMPKPSFAGLNPVAGLKRMLGGEAIVASLRACAAFALACAAVVPLAPELAARSGALSTAVGVAELAASGAQRALWSAIAVGALFAIADYALARRRWLRGLRMTLDELKRDHKEQDGDPQTRSRRRTLHRALVRGAVARTKDASFVVVNPTHVAIAVKYAPPEVPVPEILVRAADDAALEVKRLARMHAIPIVENVPLARALYAAGEAGRPIPSATYVAVARVIAELAREGVLA
jgi:flagellar biosynthesis protein FlhB